MACGSIMSMAWPIRAAYCRRLRARFEELAGQRPADAPQGPAWLVVEKILGAGERLPDDWAVDGTSGYDFMDEVSALLHDGSGEAALRALWGEVSGRPTDFAEEETAARRDVLEHTFTSQLDAAVAALHQIAAARVATRDTTRAAIRRALVALLAHFPVYRSYGVGQPSDAVAHAVAGAMKEVPAGYRPTLALLERWLGEEATPESAVRFQQLSAPLAAKAVEDTALLPVWRAAVAQRGGRRCAALQRDGGGVPCGVSRAAQAISRRDAGDRDARPQTRRGRARAARGDQRDPG